MRPCGKFEGHWGNGRTLVPSSSSLPFFSGGEQFCSATGIRLHVLSHCGTQSDAANQAWTETSSSMNQNEPFLLKCWLSQVFVTATESWLIHMAMNKQYRFLQIIFFCVFSLYSGTLPVWDCESLSERNYKVVCFTVITSQYKCSLTCSGLCLSQCTHHKLRNTVS